MRMDVELWCYDIWVGGWMGLGLDMSDFSGRGRYRAPYGANNTSVPPETKSETRN